jgi:hypothetical protein
LDPVRDIWNGVQAVDQAVNIKASAANQDRQFTSGPDLFDDPLGQEHEIPGI